MKTAYNFRRQTLCDDCTVELLIESYPTATSINRVSQVLAAEPLPAAIWLECLSSVLGIDSDQEESYSSQDFPKVIPGQYLRQLDHCDRCKAALGEAKCP